MSPRILYIPHGAGPLPLLPMGVQSHQNMIDFLQRMGMELDRPEAILVISAHWETKQPTVLSGETPALMYDYSGFPPESYDITYPTVGAPALATKVHQLLQQHGLNAKLDPQREFDHGLYIPLKFMYPAADIPCIQLSLLENLDPKQHIEIGKALSSLQNENILIIGSGFSFHNIHAAMNSPNPEAVNEQNNAFHDWLIDVCTNAALSESEREQQLIDWEQAPFARVCHPREEHFIPLHVCVGMANSQPAQLMLDADVVGKRACAFGW